MDSRRRTLPSGIIERRDADGHPRYLVRVRRRGEQCTATLGSLDEALAWRAQAIEALKGLRDAPERPKPAKALTEPPVPLPTVEDAARRLCRGMVNGTVRSRD